MKTTVAGHRYKCLKKIPGVHNDHLQIKAFIIHTIRIYFNYEIFVWVSCSYGGLNVSCVNLPARLYACWVYY